MGEPRFVPTEIYLLTTAEGAERARLTLLGDEPGWFHWLRRDYSLPDIRFTLDSLHIPARGRRSPAQRHPRGGGQRSHRRRHHEPGARVEVPADWRAPVPVPFLVAEEAKLLFGMAPRRSEFAVELPQIFTALKQALD